MVRALAYPTFGLTVDEQREWLALYLRIPRKPPKTPARRDRFDAAFLQLAFVGKADYLVSGDRHLLALVGHF